MVNGVRDESAPKSHRKQNVRSGMSARIKQDAKKGLEGKLIVLGCAALLVLRNTTKNEMSGLV